MLLCCDVVCCVVVCCAVLCCDVVCCVVLWCSSVLWCDVLCYGVLSCVEVWCAVVCCGVGHVCCFCSYKQLAGAVRSAALTTLTSPGLINIIIYRACSR